MRRKPAEVALLVEHRVLHFSLSPNEVFTVTEQARATMTALPDIKGMVARRNAAAGVLARIHRDGRVTRWRSG